MVGSKGIRKERPSKGDVEEVGLKDPKVPGKEHVGAETSGPRAYPSMMDSKDLTYIHVTYSVSEEFE